MRNRFSAQLGENDIQFAALGATNARRIEKRYSDLFKRAIDDLLTNALQELVDGTFNADRFDFQSLVTAHAIAAERAGIETRPKGVPLRLAKGPTIQAVFKLWDRWRKGEKIPLRQKQNAKSIRDVFLHTVETFWKRHSRSFLRGDVFDMSMAKEALRVKAKIVVNRANMIVATETTAGFNAGRKALYQGNPGVTHWLFMAVLDKRTTKWCCDYRKKGRDGLVYEKDDPRCERETPPVHYNCRSDMLPLSDSNPRHRALINDPKRMRDNNSPAPLLRGWVGR